MEKEETFEKIVLEGKENGNKRVMGNRQNAEEVVEDNGETVDVNGKSGSINDRKSRIKRNLGGVKEGNIAEPNNRVRRNRDKLSQRGGDELETNKGNTKSVGHVNKGSGVVGNNDIDVAVKDGASVATNVSEDVDVNRMGESVLADMWRTHEWVEYVGADSNVDEGGAVGGERSGWRVEGERFCGGRLSPFDGDSFNRPVTARVHGGVYYMYFTSGQQYTRGSGYKLSYTQSTQCHPPSPSKDQPYPQSHSSTTHQHLPGSRPLVQPQSTPQHPHTASQSHPSSHPHASSQSQPSSHPYTSSQPYPGSNSYAQWQPHPSSHPHTSAQPYPGSNSHKAQPHSSSQPHTSSQPHPSSNSHKAQPHSSSHPHTSSQPHPSSNSQKAQPHSSSHPYTSQSYPGSNSHTQSFSNVHRYPYPHVNSQMQSPQSYTQQYSAPHSQSHPHAHTRPLSQQQLQPQLSSYSQLRPQSQPSPYSQIQLKPYSQLSLQSQLRPQPQIRPYSHLSLQTQLQQRPQNRHGTVQQGSDHNGNIFNVSSVPSPALPPSTSSYDSPIPPKYLHNSSILLSSPSNMSSHYNTASTSSSPPTSVSESMRSSFPSPLYFSPSSNLTSNIPTPDLTLAAHNFPPSLLFSLASRLSPTVPSTYSSPSSLAPFASLDSPSLVPPSPSASPSSIGHTSPPIYISAASSPIDSQAYLGITSSKASPSSVLPVPPAFSPSPSSFAPSSSWPWFVKEGESWLSVLQQRIGRPQPANGVINKVVNTNATREEMLQPQGQSKRQEEEKERKEPKEEGEEKNANNHENGLGGMMTKVTLETEFGKREHMTNKNKKDETSYKQMEEEGQEEEKRPWEKKGQEEEEEAKEKKREEEQEDNLLTLANTEGNLEGTTWEGKEKGKREEQGGEKTDSVQVPDLSVGGKKRQAESQSREEMNSNKNRNGDKEGEDKRTEEAEIGGDSGYEESNRATSNPLNRIETTETEIREAIRFKERTKEEKNNRGNNKHNEETTSTDEGDITGNINDNERLKVTEEADMRGDTTIKQRITEPFRPLTSPPSPSPSPSHQAIFSRIQLILSEALHNTLPSLAPSLHTLVGGRGLEEEKQ